MTCTFLTFLPAGPWLRRSIVSNTLSGTFFLPCHNPTTWHSQHHREASVVGAAFDMQTDRDGAGPDVDLYLSHVSPGWSMAPSFDRIKHPERYFLFAMPQPNDVALPTSQGSLSGGRCVRHANRSRWRRTQRRPTCRTHGTVARHALPVPPRGKASIPLQYEELSHDLRFSQ